MTGRSTERVELRGRLAPLYRLLEWPLRLAAANLLWVAGCLAGLVVAGVGPSTVALYWLVREYALGRNPSLWRGFWSQWRAELARAQVRVGVPLATVVVLAFYLVLAARQPAPAFRAVTAALAILLLLYLATLPYVPAVLAHFDLATTAGWRVAAVAAWRQPLLTLGICLLNAGLVASMVWFLPAALAFFGVSVPALLTTKAALHAFDALTRSSSP